VLSRHQGGEAGSDRGRPFADFRVEIDLSEIPSVRRREISEGVVLDYDAEGNLVGIDIDHASRKMDLRTLTLSRLAGVAQTSAAQDSAAVLWRLESRAYVIGVGPSLASLCP
jgi:uncharacterized protein YuzE